MCDLFKHEFKHCVNIRVNIRVNFSLNMSVNMIVNMSVKHVYIIEQKYVCKYFEMGVNICV